MKLFSPDSKFYNFLSSAADMLILNMLFGVCCIPVVTIGASATALYTVVFRMGTAQEGSVVLSFFRAFRENFKQSTVLWLGLLLIGAVMVLDSVICFYLTSFLHYGMYLFLALTALVIMATSHAFPWISQFATPTKMVFKNVFALSMAYLPRSILMAVLNLLPIIIFLLSPISFLRMGILWFSVYYSGVACITVQLLRKIFTTLGTHADNAVPETEAVTEGLEE